MAQKRRSSTVGMPGTVVQPPVFSSEAPLEQHDTQHPESEDDEPHTRRVSEDKRVYIRREV
jgi:hypothetical protein